MTVYALYQLYMHSKVTLIVTYDLILTLFDNIRICFEIPESVLKFLMNRFLFKGGLKKIF